MKRPHTNDFVSTEPFAPNTQPITEIPGDSGLSTNVRQLGDGRSEASGVSTGALLGYARVSREDQNLDRQLDALREAGCDRTFVDEGVSGARASRPGLDEMLLYVRPGDAIVVQALDRLGRRTSELLRLVEAWKVQGIGLKILNLGIDTNTSAGKLVLTIMSSLAEMEREVLRERTIDGLAAARRRGKRGGRPSATSPAQRREALRMRKDGRSLWEIAQILGCSERTIRRVLAMERK